MKHLIFFVFIGFTVVLSAQPISNYLDYSTEWRLYGQGVTPGTGTTYYNWTTVFFDGDTIVNGINYYKRYYIRVSQNQGGNPTSNGRLPLGYYRETADLKFIETYDFFYQSVEADFKLMVGDTFPENICPVETIDSIYHNSMPLKRFIPLYASSTSERVIESVGLIGPVCFGSIEGGLGRVVCYIKGSDTLQFNSYLGISCDAFPEPIRTDVSTSVDEFSSVPSVSIQPNPVTDQFVSTFEFGAPVDVRVYGVSGSLVLAVNGMERGELLSVAGLERGFYVVGYFVEGELVGSGKMVKE